MAYTKNTWADGDVVTSAKLNHMEDGIANNESVFVVGEITFDSKGGLVGTLDKTWQEIHDAMMQNKICIAVMQNDDVGGVSHYFIKAVFIQDNTYYVDIEDVSVKVTFSASTASGYPSR